ncbi:MAG: cytochrome c peroxidase, partial [Bdellovibrionota bacterium]|nr:cytochrome c peroxidase [Bdellovibrionota bacterium]
MKAVVLSLCLFFSLQSIADTDAKLKQIIQRFGLRSVEAPKGFNEAQYSLGQMLFFDPILSGSKNISCSSCHSFKAALGDSLPLALGVGALGEGLERKRLNNAPIISRNSPALFNVGHEDLIALFWDGRVSYNEDAEEFYTPEAGLNGEFPKYSEITGAMKSALSAQALFPMSDHKEMLGKNNEFSKLKTRKAVWDAITLRILNNKTYQAYLKHIYPNQKINIGHIAEALAHFQKFRFASFNTPWDQYLRGDLNALTESQKLGALVFAGNGRCVVCHNGALLGGTTFHNVVSP